jgi:hypothetical protein
MRIAVPLSDQLTRVREMLASIPRGRLFAGYGIALALLTAVLGVVAYWMIFSHFNVPDDDGYLLMQLRHYNAGGALYEDVYSQYGPGVFVLVGNALELTGLPLTSDGARLFNLALWLLSTLLVGLVLLRMTRSFFVSGVGLLVGFLVLQADASEPLHPGGTIGFLLIALVAAAAFLLPSRERAAMATIGVIAAALLSIKVNVGIFAIVSIAVACTFAVPALRERRALPTLAAATLLAIPILLLSEHLGQDWAFRFAFIVVTGSLALLLVGVRLPASSPPTTRGVVALVAGLLATLLVVSVVPIVGGTSPTELVDGWFIRSAETPEIQYAPLLIHEWAWVWAAFGLGAAIAVSVLWGLPGPRWRGISGILRVGAGLLIWTSLVGPIFDLPQDLTQSLVVGAPLLWVAAIPPGGAPLSATFPRMLVPALAALQFLHAYPMPGSQLVWGSFLLVLVGGICVADGIEDLAAYGSSWRPAFGGWRATAMLTVVAFGTWLMLQPLRDEAREARAAYREGVPLGLPGTDRMRVIQPLAEQMQDLSGSLRANCDTFLTIPGMNSLNIFSEREPPVELSGPWPFFFTTEEQQEIVDRVEGIRRFCIVHKPDLLAFWAGFSKNTVPNRPLVRYIQQEFQLLRDFSGYRLLVRRGGAHSSPSKSALLKMLPQ